MSHTNAAAVIMTTLDRRIEASLLVLASHRLPESYCVTTISLMDSAVGAALRHQ
jgi:hypothetical protein